MSDTTRRPTARRYRAARERPTFREWRNEVFHFSSRYLLLARLSHRQLPVQHRHLVLVFPCRHRGKVGALLTVPAHESVARQRFKPEHGAGVVQRHNIHFLERQSLLECGATSSF